MSRLDDGRDAIAASHSTPTTTPSAIIIHTRNATLTVAWPRAPTVNGKRYSHSHWSDLYSATAVLAEVAAAWITDCNHETPHSAPRLRDVASVGFEYGGERPISISPASAKLSDVSTSEELMTRSCYLLTLVLALASCQTNGDPAAPASRTGAGSAAGAARPVVSMTVAPGGSIQRAIDGAAPYTTIHVLPGVYRETIRVTTQGLRLVGAVHVDPDNDEADDARSDGADGQVVLQNPGTAANGVTITANAVTLEGLTVRGFDSNGVVITGVRGFRLAHVVADRNGSYGLFPSHATDGVITYCTVIGHNDAGIYVGQAARILVEHNMTTANVSGIEIENAHDVVVRRNRSIGNTTGILVQLLPGKDVTTSADIRVVHNTVRDNNLANFGHPGDLAAVVPTGAGIIVLGPDRVVVAHNRVSGNASFGIGLGSVLVLGALAGLPPSAFAGIDPNPDDARVEFNDVRANGFHPAAELAGIIPGADLVWDGSGRGNCWEGNRLGTAFPASLPTCP